jgi:hypothetical protein
VWWSVTITSIPAARAAATWLAAVIPQSTVTSSSVPREASRLTPASVSPYPSDSRSGMNQSQRAPSSRSVATRIAVEHTPSTS